MVLTAAYEFTKIWPMPRHFRYPTHFVQTDTPPQPSRRFLRDLFDEETYQRTLAFLRDLWGTLLAIFGIIVVFVALRIAAAIGVPEDKIEIAENVEFFLNVAIIAVAGFVFIKRLIVPKNPQAPAPTTTRRNRNRS